MNSFLDFFRKDHGLPIGARAPEIEALDQDGTTVSLAGEYARGPVLIYFYVKAGTPICTAHTCRMRDRFDALSEKGVQILGVSGDPVPRLKAFGAKHRLPFRLLSDPDGTIATGFQVPRLWGMAARDAYLIRAGRIAWKGRASARFETLAASYFLT